MVTLTWIFRKVTRIVREVREVTKRVRISIGIVRIITRKVILSEIIMPSFTLGMYEGLKRISECFHHSQDILPDFV